MSRITLSAQSLEGLFHNKGSSSTSTQGVQFDWALLLTALSLLAVGVVMVTSASVALAGDLNQQVLNYFWRHLVYLFLGLVAAWAVTQVSMQWWYQQSWWLLAMALVLLVLVLIPGIGKTVNGSTRWLNLGVISVQVSEVAKLCLIFYTAGYLVRRAEQVRASWWGFIKPLLVLMLVALLLLLQPDFGALVVTMAGVVGIIFLSGVRLKYFLALLLACIGSISVLAVSQSYRLERITAYIDPWADQYDTGYQLTQALIAFGRGEWFGVGLGNSVQKMFYLPEAHTDFVFAIVGEELGLLGVLIIIGLYAFLLGRALYIAVSAQQAGQQFNSLVAYGIALLLGIQSLINLGVNTGLLPTKGLTLPLISYGGSSLIISCVCVAILLRIHRELPQVDGPKPAREGAYE